MIEDAGIRDFGERWKLQIKPDDAVTILRFFDRVAEENAAA